MATEQPHRKVYAKGYFDGVRAVLDGAITEKDEAMNHSRFKSIFNGLSAIAQKVYGAVPISESWNSRQIHAELVRGGCAHDMRMTQGCINSLVKAGIVFEPKTGEFYRSPEYRDKPAPTGEPKPARGLQANIEKQPKEEIKVATEKQQKKGVIEKMAVLAERAMSISASLKSFANDIETTALEIEEQISTNNADMEKLKQLQTLLKSLGN